MILPRSLVLALFLPIITLASESTIYRDPAARVEARTEDLLRRLTPDEKIQMLAGTGFTTQPVTRLGIPAFRLSDGPVGVRNQGPTTAYTSGIALAASWDTALAQRVGVALGRDARARGVNILLGPGMNLYRAPVAGRNFEYFGEDPLLAGMMAGAYIRGVQSQGVAATAKHFAVNNQEFNRRVLSSDVDERTLRELYLRTFQIALREGQPWCVMNSYNRINGTFASQNHWLNVEVLKGEWQFPGVLMSDWGSTYDTVANANGGLDLEMPEAVQYTAEKVKAALASGAVNMATIDDKIRRQLRIAFGHYPTAASPTTNDYHEGGAPGIPLV